MFFEVLVSLLGEHGVTIHDANVKETGKVKIEIDFSEHDKVFKDKYKVLEEEYDKKCKDYKSVSALLSTYQQENESLKKRIIELENFSCQAEQETESLVEKLKQRISELEDKIGDRDEINRCLREQIAELESRESVNPMRIEFYADNGEPFTPLEVANSLINQNTFKVDELKELAEHLLVYCKHNKERNNEKEI